jgi:hypothetical protein
LNYIYTFGLTEGEKSKLDTTVNTSQREQYGSTVHLFIGIGRSLCKITFMPFIFSTDLWTTQQGPDGLFPFKSVPFSVVEPKLLRPYLQSSISLCLDHASHIVYDFDLCPKVPVHLLHLETLLNHVFEDLRKTKVPNIYLHRILKKTSYKLLTGKKPNVSYFRVFGSKCFILIKRGRKSKFAPKAIEGFLLGYDSNTRAYRVFNKSTGLVEVSCDIVFDKTNGSQVEQVDHNELDDEEAPCIALKNMFIRDVCPVGTMLRRRRSYTKKQLRLKLLIHDDRSYHS